ncbi:Arp2/3 complex, 34 kd subunit p34-Arc-domain-containing protein [Pelagophyceae sp. CCMP2097]|nr:Arp2/3 complex, 34 kd subunit p34-Arc-domain-containing protein [Pelagophyceae sp. CCMP2097]
MLKVESQSSILEEAVGSRLLDGKREPCEISFADFDEVLFKLTVLPGQENILTLHVALPCFASVMQQGGTKLVDKIYAGMTATPEPGYQFAVTVDCDAVADKEATLSNLMHVKRNLLGAPFIKAFELLNAGTAQTQPFVTLPYRKTEAMYAVAGNDPANPANYDRITVVISVDFPEEADRAYARIFLQQFVDVSRKINNAPPITFSEPNNPPLEIRDKIGAVNPSIVGFVSFSIFAAHVKTEAKLHKTVDAVIGFRNYLHFHIKAAKTNLHMRMRRKVTAWLQVLNRAVMATSAPKEMKTASGKTFTRK